MPRIIIRRDSHEEQTFAVIDYAGCDEADLLTKVRKAVTAWSEVAEGQGEDLPGDFNLGDMVEWLDEINPFLKEEGITAFNLEVFSYDNVSSNWDYDIGLIEN